jgi:hypothetical protein
MFPWNEEARLNRLTVLLRTVILDGMSDVTRVLSAIEQGDPHAAEQLLPLVYDELRKLAAQKLAQEKPGQTLQATALVHEAYIRVVDPDKLLHWDRIPHCHIGHERNAPGDMGHAQPIVI